MSDVHRSSSYPGDSWEGVCRHIGVVHPNFVIDTGDLTLNYVDTEFLNYKNGFALQPAPLYSVPGNHDGSADEDANGTHDHLDNYDAFGFYRHFAVDIGNFRIIGFTTYQDTPGVATDALIMAAEKAWVLNELANLGGQTPILATHYPLQFLIDGGSWATLAADLATYGVKAYLSGHDHFNCTTATTGSCVNVKGASVWGQGAGQTPGMMIWYVFSDRMEMEFQSARYPYTDFDAGTVPAYSKITINR